MEKIRFVQGAASASNVPNHIIKPTRRITSNGMNVQDIIRLTQYSSKAVEVRKKIEKAGSR